MVEAIQLILYNILTGTFTYTICICVRSHEVQRKWGDEKVTTNFTEFLAKGMDIKQQLNE
jgi:hypothetical protein